MRRYDQMSSLVWLVFALYICIESGRLSFGSFHNPGPGFLPLLVGIFLGIFSIIAFLQAFLSKETEEIVQSWYPKKRWKKLIWVLVAMFAYAFCLEILGFLVSTFLLLVFLFRAGMEPQRWLVAIGGSAIASFSSYAVFELWLKTQLPKGFLGF
jgi:putative tricarboxylic transport membrane protein